MLLFGKFCLDRGAFFSLPTFGHLYRWRFDVLPVRLPAVDVIPRSVAPGLWYSLSIWVSTPRAVIFSPPGSVSPGTSYSLLTKVSTPRTLIFIIHTSQYPKGRDSHFPPGSVPTNCDIYHTPGEVPRDHDIQDPPGSVTPGLWSSQ